MRSESKEKEKPILIIVMAVLLFGLSFLCWTKKEDKYSDSERRVLETFPKLTAESVWSGDFMKDFEEYCLDQFPFRDYFRSIKAITNYGIFDRKDNNGIYRAQGHLSKIEYPLNQNMLEYAADKMENIYHKYLKEDGSKCYFAAVVDKNYFLAQKNGYPTMDYDVLFDFMEENLSFAENIEITPLLNLDDYYKTDTHWRQECILDVAEYLKESMRAEEGRIPDYEECIRQAELKMQDYTVEQVKQPFYGVYHGQAALPLKADRLYYLNSDVLKECRVTSYDTGAAKETVIYNLEKAGGKDAYEIFLSGASALQVIENPRADKEKELIVFRDSFGSSLIPLLVDAYSKITVIDIRYVQSDILGKLVDFHGQDTLFLYSTLILNNSMALR